MITPDPSLIDQVIQEVQNNDFFRGGAILGVFATILMALKDVPLKVLGRIDRLARFRATIDNATSGRLYEAFTLWYAERYPSKLRNTIAYFEVDENERQKSFLLRYSHKTDITWIWDKLFPIVVTKSRERMDASAYLDNRYSESYVISAFFGKRRIMNMLEDVKVWYESYLETKNNSVFVWTSKYEGKYVTNFKTFDNIYHQCKDIIISDIDTYENRKSFYEHMGIRNKRSYFLWGPAGTGKTSIATAIAAYTKRDIYIINMSSFSGDEAFQDYISSIRKRSLILLEDIHTWFERNDNSVTVSSLLNMIDGILSPEDVIIVVTANRLDAIDAAFLRAGRMDMILEIGPADSQHVSEYVSNFFSEKVIINKTLTMSEVQEACLRAKSVVDLCL